VFVWTPAAKQVVQAEPTTSLSPNCGRYASSSAYSLALAGARVAVGTFLNGVYPLWALDALMLGRARSFRTLDSGFVVNGDVALSERVAGELAGADDLLVLGSLTEAFPRGAASRTVTRSQVLRAEASGCPCPTIASAAGMLAPFDVDGGRVVVGTKTETWLLDATGKRLLTLPIAALAAQLSGSDLVVLAQGQLRDYDTGSGVLRHTWVIPNVPSGRECGTPNGVTCAGTRRLVLEDAAHGLVIYVLDGHVHVLRLADGADMTVATGTLARFRGRRSRLRIWEQAADRPVRAARMTRRLAAVREKAGGLVRGARRAAACVLAIVLTASARSAVGSGRVGPACALPADPRVALDARGDAVALWLCLGRRERGQAAIRPVATGRWGVPRDVLRLGAGAYVGDPALAVDAAGGAVTVWRRYSVGGPPGYQVSSVVQAAVRSAATGKWGRPQNLSAAGTQVALPQAAIDRNGDAFVVWLTPCTDSVEEAACLGTVQAAVRPLATGTWSDPEDISGFGQRAAAPLVALDPTGDAVAVWKSER
jgi:hypothetical protein